MIPKECKRLAEVDFPIAVVSRHSAREKSIRHGHPSTLHLWWARRPLAACRAMLLALLLPDPCDTNCPDDFKAKARPLLANVQGNAGTERHRSAQGDSQVHRRLFELGPSRESALSGSWARTGESGAWRRSAAGGRSVCRWRIDSAGGAAAGMRGLRERPESGRVPDSQGDARRHSAPRAEAGRRASAGRRRDKEAGAKGTGQYYPPDPDGATPIAYLWARTVDANHRTAARRFRWFVRSGCARRPDRLRALRYEVKRPKGKAAVYRI